MMSHLNSLSLCESFRRFSLSLILFFNVLLTVKGYFHNLFVSGNVIFEYCMLGVVFIFTHELSSSLGSGGFFQCFSILVHAFFSNSEM